MFLNQSQFSTM